MDISFIADLADKSAGVILTFLGLYLFKVVVNDMKHDVEQVAKSMSNIDAVLQRIADGTSGQMLQTSGGAVLSWTTVASSVNYARSFLLGGL